MGGEKINIDQFISIVSAVGIGTIVSAVFAFVQANKRNNLDFITKERSEWRKNIKEILVDLNSKFKYKREQAVIRLKAQINPYGYHTKIKYNSDYYMNDGHIWDLLESFNYSNQECEKLSRYLELLLKYDWERSKNEVKISNNYIWKFVKIGLIILNVIMTIWAISVGNRIVSYLGLISLFFLLFQNYIIRQLAKLNFDLPKRKMVFIFVFVIAFLFPYIYSLYYMIALLNYYEVIKLDVIMSIIPVIIVLITILSEMFVLYQIYNSEKKYIAQIKLVNKKRTALEIEYYKVYNGNYKLKEEIARRNSLITQKDVDDLKKSQEKLNKQLLEEKK